MKVVKRARFSISQENSATGVKAGKWEVVTALIRGTTCRKRNLKPGVSYEFRVRACGAWGKSIFTLSCPGNQEGCSLAK